MMLVSPRPPPFTTQVEDMLQHGVAVNGRNQWGFTPLHWAASEGHKEVRPRSPESSARKPMSQTARPKFLFSFPSPGPFRPECRRH